MPVINHAIHAVVKYKALKQQELAFLRVLLCWMASADFLFELNVANSISCQWSVQLLRSSLCC